MSRASWLAAIACGLLALGAFPAGPRNAFLAPAAWAQNIGKRTVSGTVLNESSQPVVGATVFLKNEKTKTIRSYDSTADGHFHFCPGRYEHRLRSVGGEGRQEERDQNRQLVGRPQGLHLGSEAEVSYADVRVAAEASHDSRRRDKRRCRPACRLTLPAFSSPAHSAAPGWPGPLTRASPGRQRIPPSSSCRARYCSTCLGLAAITSSISFSIAEESVICCGFSRS